MIIEITNNKYLDRYLTDRRLNKVYNFFITHEDEWWKASEIINELEVTNLTFIVNKLRIDGMTIISSKRGYKYTLDNDEIDLFYTKLRKRGLIALTTAKHIKRGKFINMFPHRIKVRWGESVKRLFAWGTI